MIERRRCQAHPPRDEFVVTEMGRALWDVLAAMAAFGDEWLFEKPSEVEFYDKRSGKRVRPVVIDRDTGKALDVSTTRRRFVHGGEVGGH